MLLLPRNLARVSSLAADESARFALQGVRIASLDGNIVRVEATDGKRLIRVDTLMEDASDYPLIPAIDTAPNGEASGIVPCEDWDKAFKDIPRGKDVKPILEHLAVVLGRVPNPAASPDDKSVPETLPIATLGTTNLRRSTVHQPYTLEARYPDFDQVFPRKFAKVKVAVNPVYLAEMMQVLKDFTDKDAPAVELHVYDSETPITLVAAKPRTGQTATGLLMPLDWEKVGFAELDLTSDPVAPLQAKLDTVASLAQTALDGKAECADTLARILALLKGQQEAPSAQLAA